MLETQVFPTNYLAPPTFRQRSDSYDDAMTVEEDSMLETQVSPTSDPAPPTFRQRSDSYGGAMTVEASEAEDTLNLMTRDTGDRP